MVLPPARGAAKHGGSGLGLAEGGGLLAALLRRSPVFLFWGVAGWSALLCSPGAAAFPGTLPARPRGAACRGSLRGAVHEARGCKVPPARVAMGERMWWVP